LKDGSGVGMVLTSLLLSLVSASGLSGSQPSSNPRSAVELAKRIDDHYNHLHSLKAHFREQYEGLGMQRSESGTMLLEKPGRMRWEYSTSQVAGSSDSKTGKVFVLDGKYAWFYAPGDTQVQRIAASQLDDLRSPLRFLLGHTRIENELQNLTLSSDKNGIFALSGIPKGQQKRIAKLALTVNSGGTILGISIEEADGAKTGFTFSDEEPDAAIPVSEFRFVPPAGIPVVDALPPV